MPQTNGSKNEEEDEAMERKTRSIGAGAVVGGVLGALILPGLGALIGAGIGGYLGHKKAQ
ncbi:hypothetical protein KKH15_02320 [Patescibacteria group bacterium]|nr:hypothetical protein [Patescibacteria group bacterium]MBU1754810.1 hypothetical protein [Patescibacteria group bacterium]